MKNILSIFHNISSSSLTELWIIFTKRTWWGSWKQCTRQCGSHQRMCLSCQDFLTLKLIKTFLAHQAKTLNPESLFYETNTNKFSLIQLYISFYLDSTIIKSTSAHIPKYSDCINWLNHANVLVFIIPSHRFHFEFHSLEPDVSWIWA